jgi:hypothetical protein
MTDFFADLEAQLVGAHARRPAHRRPVVAVVAVAALVAVALALAVTLAGGPSSGERRSARPAPAATSVTVLNGTTIPGVARITADRLQAAGFKIEQVNDAPSAGHGRSSIGYAGDDRAAALAVARRLHIATVRHLPSGRPAVVVTIGQDVLRGVVRALPAATFPLRAARVRTGTAVIQRAPRLTLSVRASDLARRNTYGVWLAGGPVAPHFLGFAPVPRAGILLFSNVLPADARRYARLLITRESTVPPTRPGPTVLTGDLRFP